MANPPQYSQFPLVDALMIKNAAARDLLRELEWCRQDGDEGYESSCPRCRGFKYQGHRAACDLARVLNDA